jgi:adenine C2-methylase RlmN of 23S rRNA A2503 and tRNA A37
MGCKFCATGSMGFKSNLSSGEIVEQLVHASTFAHIRNVVFMVISPLFLILCYSYLSLHFNI